MKDFGYQNPHQAPRLDKIVVNVGIGEAIDNPKLLDTAVEELAVITGQRPKVTRASKAISNFKLREGMAIGAKVTLRGQRMYEFLDRLIEYDKVDKVHGMDITIVTTAGRDDEAYALLAAFGMPFRRRPNQ
jgi:large subunit ribosomal protein L5